MSSSSVTSFAPAGDHYHHQQQPQQQQQQLSPSDQLCYVHCDCCDTVLAVSVPCTSLFKTVTVRCGHCTNLLSVNMRGLLLPTTTAAAAAAAPTTTTPHSFFTPHSLLEDIRSSGAQSSNLLMNHHHHQQQQSPNDSSSYLPLDFPKPPAANRPPEKRQRVPSAYNRFIKDEIQRIKAGNPDISHREAFSAAAKNWAHFPHIHFGLMPDQPVKKPNVCQQEGDDVLNMKENGFLAPANVGLAPY